MYNTSDNKYQFSTISKGVIEKMLIKLDNIKDIKYILEPSACKLNSQTLKEPYNIKRKELLNKLEELNADIEYVDKLLLTNKRIIDIDKIIIYINIPEKYTESILFANLKNNKEYMTYSSHIQNDSLIEKNPIEYFPALYNNEILLGISLIKEFKSLKKYILINKNTSNYNSSNNIKLMLNNKDLTINNYIEAVRYKYWKMKKYFLY